MKNSITSFIYRVLTLVLAFASFMFLDMFLSNNISFLALVLVLPFLMVATKKLYFLAFPKRKSRAFSHNKAHKTYSCKNSQQNAIPNNIIASPEKYPAA